MIRQPSPRQPEIPIQLMSISAISIYIRKTRPALTSGEIADNVPMSVQDRAYTSPIWHTP